jgi:hypothetical protein
MKKLFPFFALAACALVIAAANPNESVEDAAPKKVSICHGPGHQTTWAGGGTDWVLNYKAGPPTARQHAYCEARGGNVIKVSAKAAENGHGAARLGRIDGYPGR